MFPPAWAPDAAEAAVLSVTALVETMVSKGIVTREELDHIYDGAKEIWKDRKAKEMLVKIESLGMTVNRWLAQQAAFYETALGEPYDAESTPDAQAGAQGHRQGTGITPSYGEGQTPADEPG
jgi:hypothetical protein